MIEREEREKKILEILRDSETLVSGTYLAKIFDVSRQVIVQDIAILKAKNIDITNINSFKGLEIDYISSGAITHSAKILDLRLKNLRYVDD